MKFRTVPLSIIAITFSLIVIMSAFGEIDFFENMSCDELEYISNTIPRGKYPFETPFTPSQLKYLDIQYDSKCGVMPDEIYELVLNDEPQIFRLPHSGDGYEENILRNI